MGEAGQVPVAPLELLHPGDRGMTGAFGQDLDPEAEAMGFLQNFEIPGQHGQIDPEAGIAVWPTLPAPARSLAVPSLAG